VWKRCIDYTDWMFIYLLSTLFTLELDQFSYVFVRTATVTLIHPRNGENLYWVHVRLVSHSGDVIQSRRG
jgi:hypothetical protein